LGSSGNLTIDPRPGGSSSQPVLTYDVGGYAPKGLNSLAPAVNTVLTEQVQRLENLLERGTP
jgi:hypothetical protein